MTDEEKHIYEIVREKIDAAAAAVRRLSQIYQGAKNEPRIARANSLVITKLEEADLWLGKSREEAEK